MLQAFVQQPLTSRPRDPVEQYALNGVPMASASAPQRSRQSGPVRLSKDTGERASAVKLRERGHALHDWPRHRWCLELRRRSALERLDLHLECLGWALCRPQLRGSVLGVTEQRYPR